MSLIIFRLFTEMWGVNVDGKLMGSGVRTSCISTKGSVDARLKQDLKRVDKRVLKETAVFKAAHLSDHDRSVRLLFWFQSDLLPLKQATVLEAKFKRDHDRVYTVSATMQNLTWAMLLLVDFWLFFYVIWFGAKMDSPVEAAWARSFALWLLLEVVFIESIAVMLTHCLMPLSTALVSAHDVKHKLVEALAHAQSGNDTARDGDFNAAEYFFISNKLALAFPQLAASHAVARFSTPLPREQLISRPPHGSGFMGSIKHWFSETVFGLFAWYAAMPVLLQDTLMYI